MADAGLPIEQVADQLGHKDLRMLQKHYRHRIKPWDEEANLSESKITRAEGATAP